MTKEQNQKLRELLNSLDSTSFTHLRQMMNHSMPLAEIAHLINSSPPRERQLFWSLLDEENIPEVLSDLGDEVRAEILQEMDAESISNSVAELDTDDLADVLQSLPEKLITQVLASMSWQDRQRVEKVLHYPEDTAGGIMDTDTITIRSDIAVEVVLRYLRKMDDLPSATDNLIVVNRQDVFLGVLSLRTLLVSKPNTLVKAVMDTDVYTFFPDQSSDEVADIFERYDLVSAAVIDENNKLIGRITVDDVIDLIRIKSDENLMNMAGLNVSDDTFAPLKKILPGRVQWLGINLITAFMAAFVIGMFEQTLEKVIALAVLMPIVASMGGIAGTQSLTIVIRALALDVVNWSNMTWLLGREFLLSIFNGLLWALVVGSIVFLWFGDTKLSGLIAVALIVNLATAAVFGAILPLILQKQKIDPALAGGVILTTITDIVGFVSFLGLASWLY